MTNETSRQDETMVQSVPQEAQKKGALQEAQEVISRFEEMNKTFSEKLARAEELMAEQLLSGKAKAGEAKLVKEETPAEYKARVMRGEA